MSSVTYEEMLREAMVDLSEMQEQDGQTISQKIGQNKKADYSYFLYHWSAMYLRYVQVARKLEQVHDQVLHPQKRHDVRIMLDSCLGRMLEMKHKIVEYCGEYINLDEALVDLKLTPDALEIPVPSYFVEERDDELTLRKKYINSLIEHHAATAPDAPVNQARLQEAAAQQQQAGGDQPMSLDQAIMVLQCNERGRQGRQRAKFHRSIYEQELHQAREFEYGSTLGKDEAATKIQKIVLGYLGRKRATTILKEELEFLGMEPSKATLSNHHRDQLYQTLSHRKMRQKSNIADLDREAKEMRNKIKVQEGGKKMEEMLDEILVHLSNVRINSKEDVLPAFPTPEEGGSLALLGKIANPLEEEQRKAAEAEAAAATKKQAPKDSKKKDDDEENLPTLSPSMFWDRFGQARERYAAVWHPAFQKTYFDDKDFDQKLDANVLRDDILNGAGGTLSELRKCVDQLVMVEVTNLRERMERERGMKKKKNKGKGKGKAKKKNVKDPTEGKKMEIFMNTAVYLNILQLPKTENKVVDYIGSHNMLETAMAEHNKLQAEQDEVKVKWQALLNNWNDYVEQSLKMNKEQFELLFKNYCDQANWMFEPSAAQTRQAIVEYGILPLGSQIIHDLAPHHNALLVYGFAKSGKSMLTEAICNEAGATFLNLSPSTFNPGQLSMQKVIQMTFRIARALAPSVIFIDEVEKVFAGGKGKKKKKGDAVAGRAAKMKKDLVQQMKELDPTDRVLVVGNSRCPWDADMKELTNFFRGMVCCVQPDYASRMELWQKLIAKKGVALPNYSDYEMLSFMTNKYTSGTISKIIVETLTERRVKRISQRPLKADEFLPALSRAAPIYKEEYDAMREFVVKLPMTMRRCMDDDLKQDEEGDSKQNKTAKKPAKK